MKESYEFSLTKSSEEVIEREWQTRPYCRKKDQDITTYETFSTNLPGARIKINLYYSSRKGCIDIISEDSNITKEDIKEKILKSEIKSIL